MHMSQRMGYIYNIYMYINMSHHFARNVRVPNVSGRLKQLLLAECNIEGCCQV